MGDIFILIVTMLAFLIATVFLHKARLLIASHFFMFCNGILLFHFFKLVTS